MSGTTTAAPLARAIRSSKSLPSTLHQISKNAPKAISQTSPSTTPSSSPTKVFHQKPWQKSPPPTPTSYFRITLTRSAIGLPKKSSRVLKFLGLHKRTSSVYHPVSSDIAGQIMKVKELVEVEETKERRTKREERESRRPESGFVVEKVLEPSVV
ncbi:uncharacterized protein EAF01_009543 [Botrytis porri]|uniref:Large ribosomal subunit protein uL30m n=1 Tax=Botrytis porri TaxID=87229 RepID=A0A4Z1KSU7_9HELO|nr:uncharacterized protein EAF01_009543 [Botrytis porri]KAF7895581.1 hypothetical protein EAF01_009543 [Botrytis porri]TGO86449.1 hypothetical protein BPOR_0302g00020 [Botrytis porri]